MIYFKVITNFNLKWIHYSINIIFYYENYIDFELNSWNMIKYFLELFILNCFNSLFKFISFLKIIFIFSYCKILSIFLNISRLIFITEKIGKKLKKIYILNSNNLFFAFFKPLIHRIIEANTHRYYIQF